TSPFGRAMSCPSMLRRREADVNTWTSTRPRHACASRSAVGELPADEPRPILVAQPAAAAGGRARHGAVRAPLARGAARGRASRRGGGARLEARVLLLVGARRAGCARLAARLARRPALL